MNLSREIVFVLGMGRSGSSAIARVLALCGGALPLDMLPANFANPTGYWEPAPAMWLNENFLFDHGSSWYDGSAALQTGGVPDAARRDLIADIAGFLGTGFRGGGTIVLKEPRISALLPYWLAAAAQRRMAGKVVHIMRGPAEVAASLAARDGLTVAHSYALWLKYNLFAERDARGVPRVFVSYDALLRDWESVVARCIAQLGLALEIGEGTRRDVAEFLSPALRHHVRATAFPASVDVRLANWVTRVYGVLRGAETGALRSAELDAIMTAYLDSGYADDFCLVRPLTGAVVSRSS